MKTALVLHGTMGSPNGNWFQWLRTELESQGFSVWLPELPNAQHPSHREEADFAHTQCPFAINEDTLIVGHSSGAILALILAQENKANVGAIVAVSVFHDNSLNWEANGRLFDMPFDWAAIKGKTNQLLFVHSDTDPYVPIGQAKYVADNCNGEMVVMPDQGHFNLERSESYRAFPELVELMRERKIL